MTPQIPPHNSTSSPTPAMIAAVLAKQSDNSSTYDIQRDAKTAVTTAGPKPL